MSNKIELTQDELLQIMLHFSTYIPPNTAIGRTRDRLLEVSKTLTPNNELYVIGQKAVTEAAEAKRELATVGIQLQEYRNAVATLLQHIENLNFNVVDQKIEEMVESIRKGAKHFAVIR